MSSNTFERDRTIFRALLDGESHKQISHFHGLSMSAVVHIAKRTGARETLALRRNRRNAEIAKAFRAGKPTKVIAAQWGLTPARVTQIAREHDLPKRSHGGPKTAPMSGAAT